MSKPFYADPHRCYACPRDPVYYTACEEHATEARKVVYEADQNGEELPTWDWSDGQPPLPEGRFACNTTGEWTHVDDWEVLEDLGDGVYKMRCPACDEVVEMGRAYHFRSAIGDCSHNGGDDD